MDLTKTVPSTLDKDYTERLVRKQMVWWKRLFDVQAPYRWNLRRLEPAFTLEIGCGIGRNLLHLKGQGVGVDHSNHSVEIARRRGCLAFTPEEFADSTYSRPGIFDSFLLAHVAEHMTSVEVTSLLRSYMPLLKPDGKIIIITPQERGFRSDATHVEFVDWAKIRSILSPLGFTPVEEYSFPLPRSCGNLFIYNEFVSVSRYQCSDSKRASNDVVHS
jgi:2-polyprenyl-3-methyl-5-hydroxy-6-metoxy-1,4-benzoquinol methylase